MTLSLRSAPWWTTLGASLTAAVAVMLLAPMATPPLYDGLGMPDEPYRWVTPPASQKVKTSAATTATALAPVARGQIASFQAMSAEQGPQISFRVEGQALVPPAGATSVSVEASPAPNAEKPPTPGVVVSNVYELTAKANNGAAATLKPGAAVLLNIRASEQTRDFVVIYHLNGSTWEQLPTRKLGFDIFATLAPSLGKFLLIKLPAGTRPTVMATGPGSDQRGFDPMTDSAEQNGPESGGSIWVYVAGGVVVLALVGGVLIARLRMRDQGTTGG